MTEPEDKPITRIGQFWENTAFKGRLLYLSMLVVLGYVLFYLGGLAELNNYSRPCYASHTVTTYDKQGDPSVDQVCDRQGYKHYRRWTFLSPLHLP
jgi:hypothetical protein